MQNGFNTFGFGPYMNYCGDNGNGASPCPTEYSNWNTPNYGGYSNGWNTPFFGGYTNGWNTPYVGGYSNGWNTPFQGGYTNGWNAPFQGSYTSDWNTPFQGSYTSDWNTPFYGGQSFGGFGGYAPNTNTVPGVDPAQNTGAPFWTGSCVTEAA